MKRAAIVTAAFALAFATPHLQARHHVNDAPFLPEGSGTLNCWPFPGEPFSNGLYPTVSTLNEEPTPTLFSEAQSRFDAENREIPISSRVRPAEEDPVALHASLPPRSSDVQRIEPFRRRRFDAPRLQHSSAPLFTLAPSTQRDEPDLLQGQGTEVHAPAVQEVQIISSGFPAEYGDCLCGPVNTCRGHRHHETEGEKIAQPSDEQVSTPTPIAEPAPIPKPTLE